ncbi:MAG TPA: class I tRNA ligase family protein [Anaerolineaceae bacterium]|nr:class I tRNA ligase family protein [Anaerolineaceae bacterium]
MTELPKAYDFAATEQRLYRWWEESGYFAPANDPRKPGFDPAREPYVISIPPANVTGELHLGHALFVAMEDLMIRYHRMKGYAAMWLPGTDHAGIATQLQVEKALAREGTSRDQLGRDAFVQRVWDWKNKYGGIITSQIRRLGASCDWQRERFTLDDGLSRAVREAFVRLYEKGLIYRGLRMINWSPGLRTAVSDLEVEYSEEPGFLYYFKYRLADNPEEYIPVATTRPETILGDTAVAVHPEDERYQAFVGRQVIVPILGRAIPVIADEYVDRAFGTGALKITPAHDPNDYAIGQKFNLPMINILTLEARINEHGGHYAGLDRFECRKKLWADMRAAGLVIKEEPYTLNVPRSQRGGEIVEPMISTQWFVKIQPLADAALTAVRDGRITIVPERFTKFTTTGWKTFRTGASAASCGGGTAFRCGIAPTAAR